MTGSKIAAATGSLIFMVGGDDAALARLQPLFQAMGKQVFHMGETGKGQATKLVMNLQIALIFEGFAEALTLGAKLGVDVEKLLPLIRLRWCVREWWSTKPHSSCSATFRRIFRCA